LSAATKNHADHTTDSVNQPRNKPRRQLTTAWTYTVPRAASRRTVRSLVPCFLAASAV
jgi:hypothetical protein